MEALRPQFDALRELLDGARSVVVSGHEQADGDAVGAVAALRRHLELEGKQVTALLAEPLNPRYGFMEFSRRYEVYDPSTHAELLAGADVFIMCDLSSLPRLGPLMQPVIDSGLATVCFDHHPTEGGGPAHVNVLDPTATATGCLALRYIKYVEGEVDREIAESVFVSLSTDTGWFRYPNSNVEVLELAAELAAYRLDLPGIYQAIYQSYNSAMVRLLGHVARSMNEECDGRLLWALVRHELIAELGVERYEVDPVLDVLRSAERSQVVALFTEKPDGRVAVSLRSPGQPDVNQVARRFGGGGHVYAAGTMLPAADAEDMRKAMVAELRRLLEGR